MGVPGAPNGNQGLGPRPGHKRLRKDPQLGHQAGKLFGNLWGPLEGPPGRPGASRLGSPGLLDSRAYINNFYVKKEKLSIQFENKT